MNFTQALKIAESIIAQSTVYPLTEPLKNSRKTALHPAFKETKEDEFWSLGFDDIAYMQDEDDIGYQVARHSN